MALSKKELMVALNTAEISPRDRIGMVGEVGICGATGASSAVAASTLLTTTSTTTTMVTAPVLGSKALGALLGAKVATTATVLVAAPFAGVAVAALGGIALSYGLIKLVKNGKEKDIVRQQYIQELNQRIETYDHHADDSSKIEELKAIYQQLVELQIISSDSADFLLGGILNGMMNLDLAFQNAINLLDSPQAA
jgi:hypothetical protein